MHADNASGGIRVIFVTIDAGHAADFARTAVERGLVACANLMSGARSIYRWKGEICEETETLIWMEAREEGLEQRLAALAALHPYETPKVIALRPDAVLEPFRLWCRAASDMQPHAEPPGS